MSTERWSDLPREARDALQQHVGQVTAVDHQSTGLHSEFSAAVKTQTGTFFVKGTSLANPHLWMHRNEARVNRFLPALAPRLLCAVETAGWLLHGFEHVVGRHATLSPGSADLPLVADSLSEMHQALTPCPDIEVGRFATQWDRLSPWQQLRDNPPDDMHPWTASHLGLFADRERDAIQAVDGDSLAHTDMHGLNILVGQTARVIDWAWARRVAGWIDVAFLVIRLIDAGHSPQAAECWASALPAWQNAPDEALSLFAGEVLGVWELLQRQRPLPHRARLTNAARTWANHRHAPLSPCSASNSSRSQVRN